MRACEILSSIMSFLTVFFLLVSSVSPFPLASNLGPVESPGSSRVFPVVVDRFIELRIAYLIVKEFRNIIVQNAPYLGINHLIE